MLSIQKGLLLPEVPGPRGAEHADPSPSTVLAQASATAAAPSARSENIVGSMRTFVKLQWLL